MTSVVPFEPHTIQRRAIAGQSAAERGQDLPCGGGC